MFWIGSGRKRNVLTMSDPEKVVKNPALDPRLPGLLTSELVFLLIFTLMWSNSSLDVYITHTAKKIVKMIFKSGYISMMYT